MLYAAATIGARRAAKRKHAGARALPTRDRTMNHKAMAKSRRHRHPRRVPGAAPVSPSPRTRLHQ